MAHLANLAREFVYLGAVSAGMLAVLRFPQIEGGAWWVMEPRALPLNFLLAALPLALLRCRLPRRDSAVVALVAVAGLSYLNFTKLFFLHEPLGPSDAFKLPFLPFMAKFFGVREYLAIAACGLAPVALLLHAFRRRPPESATRFAPAPILAVLILLLFTGPGGVVPNPWLRERLFPLTLREPEASERYGYLLNFALNAEFWRLSAPTGYSADQIRSELPVAPRSPSGASPATAERDVVVILLESFYDLPVRRGLSFRTDFLPFFHSLQKESRRLSVLSPKSGGGTADVEYEVLTGLPIHALPGGAVPYEQFVQRPIPNIVRSFADHGYQTIALHTWSQKAWNREGVYPLLGFRQFIAGEQLPQVPSSPTDATVFRVSADLLSLPRGRKRMMQFIATANTHAPYVKAPGGATWLTGPRPDPALADEIDAYATAMHVLDGRLAAYFRDLRKLPNPPIVVLFGDHQPEFTGVLPGGGDPLALYRTEALVWGEGPGDTTATQDMYCLAPRILALAGLPADPSLRFVGDFCERVGSIWTLKDEAENTRLREAFRRLSYDRLFGAGYSAAERLPAGAR